MTCKSGINRFNLMTVVLVFLIFSYPIEASATLDISVTNASNEGLSLSLVLKKKMEEWKNNKIPIIYSECKIKNGKAVLLFLLGEKIDRPTAEEYGELNSGMFVEIENQEVVNLGSVFLAPTGRPILGEGQGGVYTYERIQKLIDELTAKSFQILAPQKIKEITNSKPKGLCSEFQPEH